jgi:hypothetical protein
VILCFASKEVLDALTDECPHEYFAGKTAMGLFARKFIGRLLADNLILVAQVSVLHALLGRSFDELEPLAKGTPAPSA